MSHTLNPHTSTINSSGGIGGYSQLVLERDRRLSPALEEILRDVILANASDYGVDLAVGKIFVGYKPGAQRWEQLQYPNIRWLTCKTEMVVDQPSQALHINLLDGALRVDGRLLGGLPDHYHYHLRKIFRNVCTCCSF